MEVTREHLVGLEMALELANDRAAWGMTNNLRDLIRLAEAAPMAKPAPQVKADHDATAQAACPVTDSPCQTPATCAPFGGCYVDPKPCSGCDEADKSIAALTAERDAALALLEEVSYRLLQGKVWAGMSWTYTPIHPTKLIRLAEKIDALLASQSPPAP